MAAPALQLRRTAPARLVVDDLELAVATGTARVAFQQLVRQRARRGHCADQLEQRQVRAYLDAITDFPREGQRQTAADMGSRQGAHLAIVRTLRGLPPAEGPFVTGAV